MGGILFFSSVVAPLRTALNGDWNMVTDLPFHLCGISGLICSFLPFLKRKQALFDFVFYTGVIGGIMSVLTPQMNGFDGSDFVYLEYYVRHVLIFLLPLYMLQNLNIKPSKYSVLTSFVIYHAFKFLFRFQLYVFGRTPTSGKPFSYWRMAVLFVVV